MAMDVKAEILFSRPLKKKKKKNYIGKLHIMRMDIFQFCISQKLLYYWKIVSKILIIDLRLPQS